MSATDASADAALDLVLGAVPEPLAARWRIRTPRALRRVADSLAGRGATALDAPGRAAVARAVSHVGGPWSAPTPGVPGRERSQFDRGGW